MTSFQISPLNQISTFYFIRLKFAEVIPGLEKALEEGTLIDWPGAEKRK
jgi:hypothetical protein